MRESNKQRVWEKEREREKEKERQRELCRVIERERESATNNCSIPAM